MKHAVIGICLAMIAAPSGAASLGHPSPGYVYFHRTGADLASHNTAVEACAGEAAKALAPSIGSWSGSGVLGEIITNIERDGVAHVNFAANLENCMVVRGWDVVRLDDHEGARIASLDQPQQAAALAPLVGAPDSEGQIVRRYEPAGRLNSEVAGTFDSARDSLSLTADLDTAKLVTFGDKKPNIQSLSPSDDPAGMPAQDAVIVVRATTIAPAQAGIVFLSLDAHDDESTDRKTTAFSVATPTRLFWEHGSFLEKTYVYAVPPGRWRIAAISSVGFCLGGPAFDVRAGDAIFAGSFSANDPYVPDMALAPAKADLGDIALARRMRPANYTNGETFPCERLPVTLLYKLELPGFPFVDGSARVSGAALAPLP